MCRFSVSPEQDLKHTFLNILWISLMFIAGYMSRPIYLVQGFPVLSKQLSRI